jgi:hypothetical protein
MFHGIDWQLVTQLSIYTTNHPRRATTLITLQWNPDCLMLRTKRSLCCTSYIALLLVWNFNWTLSTDKNTTPSKHKISVDCLWHATGRGGGEDMLSLVHQINVISILECHNCCCCFVTVVIIQFHTYCYANSTVQWPITISTNAQTA